MRRLAKVDWLFRFATAAFNPLRLVMLRAVAGLNTEDHRIQGRAFYRESDPAAAGVEFRANVNPRSRAAASGNLIAPKRHIRQHPGFPLRGFAVVRTAANR